MSRRSYKWDIIHVQRGAVACGDQEPAGSIPTGRGRYCLLPYGTCPRPGQCAETQARGSTAVRDGWASEQKLMHTSRPSCQPAWLARLARTRLAQLWGALNPASLPRFTKVSGRQRSGWVGWARFEDQDSIPDAYRGLGAYQQYVIPHRKV